MPDIAQIIASNAVSPWLYLPAAVVLGALHALEPGHAKSIMAAFIVAVRGTPAQAVPLGVSAAIGHTLVVWVLVLAAIWFGNDLIEQQAYPWLVLISSLMIIAIAIRLLWTLRPKPKHGDRAHAHDHESHDGHDHNHGHEHVSPQEIAERYSGRRVGPLEITWFGLTGGLMPCPSAIAVLLVALKLNAVALGAAMVGAFSLGLAVTLVTVGLIAAWGTRKAVALSGFERFARVLPAVSASIVLALGLAVTLHGLWLVRGQSEAGHVGSLQWMHEQGCDSEAGVSSWSRRFTASCRSQVAIPPIPVVPLPRSSAQLRA